MQLNGNMDYSPYGLLLLHPLEILIDIHLQFWGHTFFLMHHLAPHLKIGLNKIEEMTWIVWSWLAGVKSIQLLE